jgi:FAD/FMN-containing dehydrogenase
VTAGGGRTLRRGEAGYEEARRAAVWNGRLPDRFPAVIVQAADEHEVVAALALARAEGLRVGVRSGGHSWGASHLRADELLLDVSALDAIEVSEDGWSAVVGPGRRGHELCDVLAARGRFFPAGHCRGVAVGGYLLQGGYGWDGRRLGPACESVTGVDVVTADGQRLHAGPGEHEDLYWAARGAGPGFFAVVTAFHLRLQPAPEAFGMALYVYPVEVADELFAWARAVGPEVDRRVEFQLVASRDFGAAGAPGPGVAVVSPVVAESEAAALQAVALFEACPLRDRATVAAPFVPMDLPSAYDLIMEGYPDGHRFAVDNMWTHAPYEDLAPGLRAIVDTLPPPPSHLLWLQWGPNPPRADMAYSVEDDLYLALYAGWADPADDARYAGWPAAHMAAMAPLSTGIQLADENLAERPGRFLSDPNHTRLAAVRARYDPEGLFCSWADRP